MAAVVVTTGRGLAFGLAGQGVAIVGEVPQSLPPLTLPGFARPAASSSPCRRC